MAANPATAVDLPLKLIVWEDAENSVWVAYNEAVYIGERYNLSEDLYNSWTSTRSSRNYFSFTRTTVQE